MRETDIIVVGAGVAGLSAGLHLTERGLRPLVLEADPEYVGGRVAGGEVVELDGWRFRGDHGVHAIWSPYHNLQAALARHSIRPVSVPAEEEDWLLKYGNWVKRAPVGSAIRHSWVPAPFHYFSLFVRPRFWGMLGFDDLLGFLPVWGGLLWGLGIDPLGEGQPMEGLWLSDLVNGWSIGLRSLFIGLTRNGLSAQPEEIPLSGFVAFLRFYTLLRRDAWIFSYLPADGGTSLAEPLAGRVRELGGTIEMGAQVTGLERDDHGWLVQTSTPSGEQGESLHANQVILATDSPNTRAILGASASDLYWPRGLATAVVRLWFDREPRRGSEAGILSGEFTPDSFFWLHRIQDSYVRWHRATGGSAVEVHIYGPPVVLEEPDPLLLARTINDVQSAFPELRGHRIHQVLRRNQPTHTLFGVGPAGRHLGIETPWPDLYCCGDWVRHPSPAFFMERACVTGIEAANAVLRSRDLPVWKLLPAPEPEPLAALMQRMMLRGRGLFRRRKRGVNP
ncbi:MAG TPA: FAD-dependent oxidoreductase [Anaerolineae bacterium]|nr:FAD-dependent oxidoreductase [Anaerolineae bacterium]